MTASSLNLGPYRYRPAKQLDETRMSTLWLASEVRRDSTNSPGSQVIIKIARMTEREYSLTNQRAIENEEKWLVHLDHPNIIRLRVVAERQSSQRPIYRARSDLPGNPWFLVTDYLPGGDLQSLLSEHRKLPASLALEIAEQLCEAIAYLHARNCVHCDIKPRNILFRERPAGYGLTEATRPILIDFGIAKNPADGPQLASGTPRWITPELYQAMRIGRKIEVNPTWDTYAAGLVLYTMVTGRKPELDNPGSHSWKPLTPADLDGDPTVKDARALAEGLNRLIAGATADRVEQRMNATSLAEGVRALQQFVRKPGAATAPAVRHQQRSSKGLWMALAGGVAALVLAGALLLNDAIPGGSGQNSSVTPTPTAVASPAPTTVASNVVAVTPTATHAPTIKPTLRPTSTPLNTPTPTSPPSATPTRTSTPTPKPTSTPTSTALAVLPTAAVIASATPRPSTPTATLLRTPAAAPVSTDASPTSTPVPTSTSTRLPTPTQTLPPQPTATPTPAEMRATLMGPANNTNIEFNSQVTFSWQPSRPLNENECFEVAFWQGDAGGWQSGWGIWDAGNQMTVRRVFNDDYETASAWLKPGATYSWGVLLVEECQPYNGLSRRLISEVRTISYRK